MTTTGSAGDVLALLREDHCRMEVRLAEFDTIALGMRVERFWKLVNELVRHEVAEEIVVYPALRRLRGGDAIADARIAEEAVVERKLADMGRRDAESEWFARQMLTLRSAVLSHAKAEESTVFALLRDAVPEARRLELGARYAKARAAAPTHPHPHVPDRPPGNVVLGPLAAFFDKLRDRARGQAA